MTSQQGGSGARPKTPRQGCGPTQQASTPAKEGWLFVQRKTLFGLVKKRRYCVLEGQSRLVIYKDRTKTKVKAVYPLQQALGVTATILHSGYVVEVRMTGNEPPLVLASRDQADMLDWIDSLDGAIFFARRTARPAGPQSLGMAGEAKHQAEVRTDTDTCQQPQAHDTENKTDSCSCQQSGLSDAEGSGPTQQASAPAKEGWLFEPAGTTLFGLVKRQKRRYFVLEGQSRLVIYKGRTKTKVEAVLHLQQAVNATGTKLRTRMFGTYVFEIRMTGDEPPLVLVSRDKADMLDWIYTLNVAITFINGPARHVNCPSQGMTGGAKHQAEDRTDPSTCQQSGLSDAEDKDLCKCLTAQLDKMQLAWVSVPERNARELSETT